MDCLVNQVSGLSAFHYICPLHYICPDEDVLWMCVTVPVTGRANAVCNDIDEPCEVSHSACVDGICVCVDGFLPTHDFACCKCSHDTDPGTAPTLADTKGFVAATIKRLQLQRVKGLCLSTMKGVYL